MTMKRSEKASHGKQIASARDYGTTTAIFAHPDLIARCRAEGRKPFLTEAEYRRYRMGRGTRCAGLARDDFREQSRYPRRTVRR